MPSSNDHRVSKRMHQACQNCRLTLDLGARRKKTRCPGERPACSSCTRLYQVCRYSNTNGSLERPPDDGRRMETRLAQLEENMALVLERVRPDAERQPQAETPKSYNGGSPSPTARSSPVDNSRHSTIGLSSLLPDEEVIQEVIGLYFHYCHRNPVWLFHRNEFSDLQSHSAEVIFAILALAIRYSKHAFFRGRSEQLSRSYCDACRTNIMLRIANGTVDLSTIQSLCLLAFANFVAKDTHLAWLHISLASNLCRCAGLEAERNFPEFTPAAEAGRRAFWSIHVLQQIYGQGNRTLVVLEDIANPRYLGIRKDPERQMRATPPFAPEESFDKDPGESSGIWTYVAQLASLWSEVRGYVSTCAEGHNKHPWSPESGYTVIGAHLMDLETSFPTRHRWDSALFGEQSPEDLQRNRDYWGPWLFIQFTHHAVHSMLNHPFLYSAKPQQSPNLAIPNTFWKTSLDLALLHATWIVRLIEMVLEKDFQVSDPFLGHCAAIAATIHIYYCRAAITRVGQSAQNNLAKCIKFINDLGAVWPVCQMISERLDNLVQLAFASSQEEPASRKVSINTALMWDLLNYTCPRTSEQQPGRGLFDPSLFQDSREEAAMDHTVETQIFYNPTAEVNTLDGGQVAPPYSDLPTGLTPSTAHSGIGHLAVAGPGQEQLEQQLQQTAAGSAASQEQLAQELQEITADWEPSQQQLEQNLQQTTTWPGAGIMGAGPFMNITYDPFFQFYVQDSPPTTLWEIGNL